MYPFFFSDSILTLASCCTAWRRWQNQFPSRPKLEHRCQQVFTWRQAANCLLSHWHFPSVHLPREDSPTLSRFLADRRLQIMELQIDRNMEVLQANRSLSWRKQCARGIEQTLSLSHSPNFAHSGKSSTYCLASLPKFMRYKAVTSWLSIELSYR